MNGLKDPVWLCVVFGPLLWVAALTPLVDRSDPVQFYLWLGGSFCLNLALVSMLVPWLLRLGSRG
jgi:hypothetical protein